MYSFESNNKDYVLHFEMILRYSFYKSVLFVSLEWFFLNKIIFPRVIQ